MVELMSPSYFRFRFFLPNSNPRMLITSRSVFDQYLLNGMLINPGSNDMELKAGVTWGYWSIRKHEMLFSIENGQQKVVLTDDGFIVLDPLGGFVVEGGVEKFMGRLEGESHVARAEMAARIAEAKSKMPKVSFKVAP